MIGYTVIGLNPSSDAVPHNGQLYAATVKVEGWAVGPLRWSRCSMPALRAARTTV